MDSTWFLASLLLPEDLPQIVHNDPRAVVSTKLRRSDGLFSFGAEKIMNVKLQKYKIETTTSFKTLLDVFSKLNKFHMYAFAT